ncbi:TRAFAC clade GTPase domain-containing protein [Phytoactinopolyspora halotolerans]|uniref:Double-GTPase 2 domain-containing protein n=1 Tax=Phytoactinopolyspora halotolerans TaxID=1981512 RepID=A0A6L9SFC9_9ACTN|nr:hypothetical protein [Phytoactinopolyspora halotolerans]NEE02770.1 hypothetical protein [Phytoactinopolyspora halotolerans]
MSQPPMNTTRTCPYCGRDVVLGKLPIVATNFGDRLTGEPLDRPASGAEPLRWVGEWPVVAEAPLPASQTSNRGPIGRARESLRGAMPLPRPTELAAFEDSPARLCTHDTCLTPLPAEIDTGRIFIVPVVGTVAAGKSSYLTVVLQQAWREQRLARFGFEQFTLDEQSVETYRQEYHRRLFRRKEILPGTQFDEDVAKKPLVCRIQYEGSDPALLFLHDIGGEMLMDKSMRRRFGGFMRRADAIIFLIDPVCLDRPDGRSWAERGVLHADDLDYPQGPLFRACVEELEPGRRTPIAVTLSKSDLVADALPEIGRFLKEPSDRQDADEWNQDLSDLEQTVIRALQGLSEWDLLNAQRMLDPELISFHAVAALGSNPQNGEVIDLAPQRCIDPLATVLFRIPALTEPAT